MDCADAPAAGRQKTTTATIPGLQLRRMVELLPPSL
jgi:hypothetical protein